MKTKILLLTLFLSILNQLFAQVPFPHNASDAGTLKAERVASFTVNGTGLDRFEITNATKFDNQFSAALWAHKSSDNRNPLLILATTFQNMDSGDNPIMKFTAGVSPGLNLNSPTIGDFPWGNDQTLQTVNTRPLFSWSNGPSTVMLLSAQNNLGIGTTTPTARLHTNGTVRFEGLPNDSNASFMLGTDANGNVKEFAVPTGGDDDVDWLTTSGGIPTNINDDMYTNGKVGIGVTNPIETLHLNGNIRGNQTSGALRINTDSGYLDIGPKSGSFSNFDTDAPAFRFNKEVHILGGVITSASVGGPSGNKNLKLQTVGTTRIFADFDNGNVGIGTETPLERLDINGSIRGNQTAGAVRINTDHGYLDLGAKTSSFSSLDTDRPAFRFNKEVQISGGTLTSVNSFIPAESNLKLQTVGTTRILVENTTGNVGINTLSPTAILHTNGDVRFENLPLKNVEYLLGTDIDGNVFRIMNGVLKNTNVEELTKIVEKQQMQIEELQKQINLLISNTKSSQNQLKASGILSLSPNPSTNRVDITMELNETVQEANIVVTSNIGAILKRIPVMDRGAFVKKTIHKDGLSAGSYLITLETDGIIIDTKKVIFK